MIKFHGISMPEGAALSWPLSDIVIRRKNGFDFRCRVRGCSLLDQRPVSAHKRQVRRDPGRSEAVVGLGGDAGCRGAPADHRISVWHRAPRRQYVISLAGGISITASDGETRHIGAGEVVLVEDTTGKGHITRSSGDGPRHTIFVPID